MVYFLGEEYMQVVNVQTREVLARFDEKDIASFTDKAFSVQLALCGIKIPPDKRKEYEGRFVVYPVLNEEGTMARLFKKAFQEIYCERLENAGVQLNWEKI